MANLTVPTMTPHGEGYLFEWPNQTHRIKIEHIREKDWEPYAEISVMEPDDLGLLRTTIGPKWAGLMGTRAIPAIGKAFAEQMYGGQPQMTAHVIQQVEEAARLAMVAHRQGPPVLYLPDYVPEETELRWLLSPVIPQRQPTVIVANGGGGKSLLGLTLAVVTSAAIGFPGIGRPCLSGPVLYLDWETDEHDHGRRLGLITRGLGISPAACTLHYLKPRQEIRKCSWIASRVAELKPVLVVIDSVGYAMGGDLIEPGPVTDMFRQINAWGVSTLLLHHTNREGGFYGSAYLWNSSRSFWEMGTEREYKGLKLTLTQTKMTNAELHHSPIELRLRFGDDRITWSGPDIYANYDLPYRAEQIVDEYAEAVE